MITGSGFIPIAEPSYSSILLQHHRLVLTSQSECSLSKETAGGAVAGTRDMTWLGRFTCHPREHARGAEFRDQHLKEVRNHVFSHVFSHVFHV